MYPITQIGIIGLSIVDIEKLVWNMFLNIKLDISSIGHNIINKHNISVLLKIMV